VPKRRPAASAQGRRGLTARGQPAGPAGSLPHRGSSAIMPPSLVDTDADSRRRAVPNHRFRYWLRRMVRGRWRSDSVVAYDGEFGHELKGVVPYAYWLHRQGRLRRTSSALDTRCFYFFSPRHEERELRRRHRPLRDFPIYTVFTPSLDRRRWLAPPLRERYANDRFKWPRPPLVISNKFSREWDGDPVNYLDLFALRALLVLLRDRYTIIYNRPGVGEMVTDHQALLELGDHELLAREFPDVIRLSDFWRANRDLTFNTLQCMVYANCERFISVQGGPSVLASYFGGRNVIFVRKGSELDSGAYGWFDQFSGCRVLPVSDPAALLATVRREFG
jgi:hypothetical protein